MNTARPVQKYPRFQTQTKAKVRLMGAPDWTEVTLINLSKGGACLSSPLAYRESTLIEIVVNSPNPKIRIHSFMAKVIWIKDDRIGIQFLTRL